MVPPRWEGKSGQVHAVALISPLFFGSALQDLAKYYKLTKPGIVYSNVMTAIAGYLFASRWHIHPWAFIGSVLGTACFIAASCVTNNFLDRSIDSKMNRTRKRALVTGAVTARSALLFATVLYTIGAILLFYLTNLLVLIIGVMASVSYVIVYGYAKRRSVHGTLVGTLPGTAALVAGYVASTGQIDTTAGLLVLIMVVWQMAHFYAIAIFRRDDYAAAGIPVRSVTKGVANTSTHIIWYVVAFTVVAPLLALTHRVGIVYAAAMLTLGIVWLHTVLQKPSSDKNAWARRVFAGSLLTLLGFSAALVFCVWLP